MRCCNRRRGWSSTSPRAARASCSRWDGPPGCFFSTARVPSGTLASFCAKTTGAPSKTHFHHSFGSRGRSERGANVPQAMLPILLVLVNVIRREHKMVIITPPPVELALFQTWPAGGDCPWSAINVHECQGCQRKQERFCPPWSNQRRETVSSVSGRGGAAPENDVAPPSDSFRRCRNAHLTSEFAPPSSVEVLRRRRSVSWYFLCRASSAPSLLAVRRERRGKAGPETWKAQRSSGCQVWLIEEHGVGLFA